MSTVLLHAIAHARAGDKGDRSSISVIALEERWWPVLREQVTPARVAELFSARRPRSIKRYELPQLWALNFVIDGVLDGGVNGALNLDTHGKALSSFLLTLPIRLDKETTP
jgi:hypothetical protein